jgi:chromosome segregation ATPase
MTAEGADSIAGAAVSSLDEQRAVRRAWDLAERVGELEARLSEFTERERVREMELTAARRDLDLKSASNTSLEATLLERQGMIEWLQAQVTREVDQSRELRTQAEATITSLRSERAQAESTIADERRRTEQAEARATSLQGELDAERARVSWRVANRLLQTWILRSAMRLLGRGGRAQSS